MLIVLDIGNTSTTGAAFERNRLVAKFRGRTRDLPRDYLKFRSKWGMNEQYKTIISSVVPHIDRKLGALIQNRFNTDKVYWVGRNVKASMRVRYRVRELGADRLVNAYGAKQLYRLPCLVIDFGTAITFDIISEGGTFEGGLIVPGVEISARALHEWTALLPVARLSRKVARLVGRSTQEAMTSGLLNGFGSLTDGLIEKFRALYGRRLSVIATGGYARKISAHSRLIQMVDELHTVKSLALLYELEIEKGQ